MDEKSQMMVSLYQFAALQSEVFHCKTNINVS